MVKKTIKKVKAAEKEEEPKVAKAAKADEGKQEAAKAEEPKKTKGAEGGDEKAGEAKEKKNAPKVSPEEVAKLTKEAIADILKGISNPESQVSGMAYIPKGWHNTYKRILGPYKKFLLQHSDKFTVVNLKGDNYVVVKAGEQPPAIKPLLGNGWIKLGSKAWSLYKRSVPEAEQSKESFLAAICKAVAEAPTASSKAAPAASPKTGPADKGVKKGKVLKQKKV